MTEPQDRRRSPLQDLFDIGGWDVRFFDPRERALDCPPAVQHDEGGLPRQLGHDLHAQPQLIGR